MKKLDIVFLTVLVTFFLFITIAYSTSQGNKPDLQTNTPTDKILVDHT